MKIVCPSCPAGTQLLGITSDATEVRCPKCRKRFRLVTRQIVGFTSQGLDHARTRYQLMTHEGKGRKRPRSFIGPTNVRLTMNGWVTLVYRGETLVGVADQTASYWYPIPVVPNKVRQGWRLVRVITLISALLIALQMFRFGEKLQIVARNSSGLLVFVIALVVAGAPALLWTVQTLNAARPKRGYLPRGAARWSGED